MSKIETLVNKMYKVRAELAEMEAKYQALRLEALQKVEISSRGNTVTLSYGDREVKAKKMGARNRWRVWEGKQILISEYAMGNLHDIRFMIAEGKI